MSNYLILLVFSIHLSFSVGKPMQWLPKCCPSGKVLSTDGKSCVKVISDDNVINPPPDILTVTSFENVTLRYELEYTKTFNCIRHEVFVVADDLFVTSEGEVIVYVQDDKTWTLQKTELCVDSVYIPEGQSSKRLFVALLCPSCERVNCIHKCCGEGLRIQVSEDAANVDCVPDSRSERFMKDNPEKTFVFHGFPECQKSPYLAYPGKLVLGTDGHVRLRSATIPRTEYCADLVEGGSVALLACRQAPPALKPALYGGVLALGTLFLALTLALHLWLPELRASLHSRVFLAHITCLLVGFLGLAIANLTPLPTPSTICSATAFTIQFTIMAAIFWLNVMCVDIAWTFSGLRAPRASMTLDSDGHKYLYYSLYAWGCTVVICVVTAILEYSPLLSPGSKLKPSFGATACWFKNWQSLLLLVYGPMGVLLMINITLFIYTACKIRKTQRDTASMVQHAGSKLREDRDRFSLYVKLFCLMGVTWVFEIVSWIIGGSEAYWYVTDIINALRGVFIFALFCLKKKVVLLIKAKLKNVPKFPRHPSKSTSSKTSSSMSSQRTNSFQLSKIY